MSTSQEIVQKYLMNTTQWMPMVLVKGEGAYVWDEEGKKYLDFVGGWGSVFWDTAIRSWSKL